MKDQFPFTSEKLWMFRLHLELPNYKTPRSTDCWFPSVNNPFAIMVTTPVHSGTKGVQKQEEQRVC